MFAALAALRVAQFVADVGCLTDHRFDSCDLLDRSLVRTVAPSASSVILTTGTVKTPSRRCEARPPRLRPELSITFDAAFATFDVAFA
jgi:hypothetical protein